MPCTKTARSGVSFLRLLLLVMSSGLKWQYNFIQELMQWPVPSSMDTKLS
jgi:hypothetical protein